MSLFSSGTEVRWGSLNIAPYFALPDLPNIVAEWTAILPLVIHLSSYRDDYDTIGEVALLGRLGLGFFPRLGTLSGLARLLLQGRSFLDQASIKGGSNSTVWDVRWGSVFSAANGAASAAICKMVMRRDGDYVIPMPAFAPSVDKKVAPGLQHTDATAQNTAEETFREENVGAASMSSTSFQGSRPVLQSTLKFRRCQMLHVLQYERKPADTTSVGMRVHIWLDRLRESKTYTLLSSLILIVGAVAVCMCGAYGTAAVLMLNALSRIVCIFIIIRRPPGYLLSNEDYDAYMLMAAHSNAMEWYLHIGDRAIVDTLLNKPMIEIDHEAYWTIFAAWWFKFAHIVQLTAMTFTAAQKGWDGIFLLALVFVDKGLRWYVRGNALALNWMNREEVHVEKKSFAFTGRTMLMGTIQLHSENKIKRWMDDILAPHPRRDALLNVLLGTTEAEQRIPSNLNQAERNWVDCSASLSKASATVLKRSLAEKETICV